MKGIGREKNEELGKGVVRNDRGGWFFDKVIVDFVGREV